MSVTALIKKLHAQTTVIKTKMKGKLDPCKCHAVIMMRNYALLWSKHNHGKISVLSGESHVCLKCQLLRAKKNILVLSWMTVQFWQNGKGFFRRIHTPEDLKLSLNLWRRMKSPKYFARIARDQSETSTVSDVLV